MHRCHVREHASVTRACRDDLDRHDRAEAAPPVLRLCSVFEPAPEALTRRDSARFDPIGGMQSHTSQLTRELDRLGVVQQVVTSRLGGPRSVTPIGRSTVARTGLRVRAARQLWALDALRALPPTVHVAHAHQGEDLAVLPLAVAAARRADCPLVVTLHTSVAHTLPRSRARALTALGPPVERRVVRAADAVLVLTPSAAARVVDDGVPVERVRVLPSGFRPALFAAPRPDPLPSVPHPRLLFVGRLAAQKRPLDVVAAHALLPDDVHLVVVGDGPMRRQVEQAAAASPARERVHLLGFVPHAQVPAHLQHADAFVLPSEYEELGTALVEAMAAGVPVVATAVGGIPDLVSDGVTGRLVERGDVPALATAVEASFGDVAAAARARDHVEHTHSWPVLARQVRQLYLDVASS
jgi:glycogen(starch) synthase